MGNWGRNKEQRQIARDIYKLRVMRKYCVNRMNKLFSLPFLNDESQDKVCAYRLKAKLLDREIFEIKARLSELGVPFRGRYHKDEEVKQ